MNESSSSSEAAKATKLLACRNCQRRKIRCSRHNPCIQCEDSGKICEQSSRKPRAKPRGAARREDDLRNRVASLEQLVQRLNGEETTREDFGKSLQSTNRYLANPFWSSLAGEVQALKEALEDDGDESDLEPSNSDSSSSPSTAFPPGTSDDHGFEFILCGPTSVLINPEALFQPGEVIASDLYRVHRERVDRTGKVFHIPSLEKLTQDGLPYLDRDSNDSCNLALKAVILFSAISQLTDTECEERYAQQKTGLLSRFRGAAEMRLIQADPMNTTALPTLQALLLYVVTLRRSDVSRRSWAIFALVVRLARAFGLDHESADESIYSREVRRRLWHSIVVTDVFFALDRGSEPLVTLGSFSRPLPTNVNDADFDETTGSVYARTGQVTDMTFALVTQEACACIYRINFFEDKASIDSWQHRLHLAEAQEKAIEERYLRFCDTSDDFHRLIIRIARIILTSLSLRAVRPMQRDPTHKLPSIDSPWVFELAVNTLRRCSEVGEDVALLKWKAMPWVQWHPLAVVLAGLCSDKIMELELVHEAWRLVDRNMEFSARLVADTKKGALWQPIEKLYKRAITCKQSRDQTGSNGSHNPGSTTTDAKIGGHNVVPPEPSNLDNNTDQTMQYIDELGHLQLGEAPSSWQMDDWLDWDSLVADWDALGNGDNVLWA